MTIDTPALGGGCSRLLADDMCGGRAADGTGDDIATALISSGSENVAVFLRRRLQTRMSDPVLLAVDSYHCVVPRFIVEDQAAIVARRFVRIARERRVVRGSL